MEDTKNFVGHKMDLDTDARLLQPNSTREVYNLRSRNGVLETIKSNIDVTGLDVNFAFSQSTGTNKVLGSCSDTQNNAVVYFLDNSDGHFSIVRIFSDGRLEYILRNENVLGFWENINHSFIVGNLLYWTDGHELGLLNGQFNPPRKINILRSTAYTNQYGIPKLDVYSGSASYIIGSKVLYLGNYYKCKANSTGNLPTNITYWTYVRPQFVKGDIVGYGGNCYQAIQNSTTELPTDTAHWKLVEYKHYTEITLDILNRGKIVPFQPTWDCYTDSTYNINHLRGNIFQFKTRYIYDDDEKSTWSTMSTPTLLNLENQDGFYSDSSVNNTIRIKIETGTKDVVRIQIATRINGGDFMLVDDIHKYTPEFGVLISSDSIYTYLFRNDVSLLSLDQNDVNALFSYVPQICDCQEFVQGNRLVDASITEGYDYPYMNCDLNVSYVQNDFPSENICTVSYSSGVFTYLIPIFIQLKDVSLLKFIVPNGTQISVIEYYKTNETDIDEVFTSLISLFLSFGFTATASSNNLLVQSVSLLAGSLTHRIFPQRVGGWKYSSSQDIGVVFFDELKRSTSVFKVGRVQIKSINDTVGGTTTKVIPTPIINFSISGTPPEQAVSYKFCHTNNSYQFLDIAVPSAYITINAPKGQIRINLDETILDYLKSKQNSVTQPWIWQKGDRIRILGYSNYDTVTYFNTEYDLEIIKYEVNEISGINEYIVPFYNILPNKDILIEIYRPLPSNSNPTIYLECGDEYYIDYPRSSIRAYKTTSGTINGYDSFGRTRSQSGSFVYILCREDSVLQVVDVSIPTNPVVISEVHTSSNPSNMTISGSHAYVCCPGLLQVFDMADAYHPSLIGSIAIGNNPISVKVNLGYAYVVDGNAHTVKSIAISSPSAMIGYTAISTNLRPEDIVFSGTYAFVCCRYESGSGASSSSVQVIDITDPTNITMTSTSITDGIDMPRRMATRDNVLYVANTNANNIKIYDISNPLLPTLSYTIGSIGTPYSIVIVGNYLYEIEYATNPMLRIYDISTPTPSLLGSVNTGAIPYEFLISLYVSGKYAYVANYRNQTRKDSFSTIDISDVSNPVVVQSPFTSKKGAIAIYATGSSIFNPIESRNYSDIYVSSQGDLGRPAVYAPELKHRKIETMFRWSGQYIQNTNINNLAICGYEDYIQMNSKYGKVVKIFEYGDILTVRQVSKNTSYYLSQAVLKQAAQSGNNIISTSTEVLGSKHESTEQWGCQNPESHVSVGNINFYVDLLHGAILRDGYSQTVVISDIGMKQHFSDLFSKIKNWYVKIYGGWDHSKNELIYTIYALNPNTNENIIESFLYKEEDGFKCFLEYIDSTNNCPEGYANIGQSLFAYVSGKPWIHEGSDNYNQFCGQQLNPRVTIVSNIPLGKKIFKSIKVKSNKELRCGNLTNLNSTQKGIITIKPDSTYVNGMKSILPKMIKKEGIWHAPMLRNMDINGTTSLNSLFNGENLRGQECEITLTTTDDNGLTQVFDISVENIPSL